MQPNNHIRLIVSQSKSVMREANFMFIEVVRKIAAFFLQRDSVHGGFLIPGCISDIFLDVKINTAAYYSLLH